MDFDEIKLKALKFRRVLKKNNIRPQLVILFGSYAANRAHADSDIDLAIVSCDLGKNRFKEGSTLNLMASEIDSRFEIIPVSLDQYLNPNSFSPILAEIKKTGVVLF